MRYPKEPELDEALTQGLQALFKLTQVVVEEILRRSSEGEAIDVVISDLIRNQRALISGVLIAVGVPVGIWASITIWLSTLGWFSYIGYTLGLVTIPAWIPVAGAIGGLAASGGAVYGLIRYASKRNKNLLLEIVIAFGRKVLDLQADWTKDEINKTLQLTMQNAGLSEKDAKSLITKEISTAENIKCDYLNEKEGTYILRVLYPLAHTAGEINQETAEYLKHLCGRLGLNQDELKRVESEYFSSIDKQWEYLEQTTILINEINEDFKFTDEEFATINKQIESSMKFDPRKSAEDRRKRTLKALATGAAIAGVTIATSGTADAAIMSAYVISQSSVLEPDRRRAFRDIFQGHLKNTSKLDTVKIGGIMSQIGKLDKVYENTIKKVKKHEKE